ncbi:hypothetical protein SAMN02745116_00951 [Pilibacter termitis]|uniref:Uncharacterized protein n=1 Tax=Pilibacter termitis TaxID=263852 RepID=A0A1T4M5J5_9ENTE|nr:hypothetical protein [Pilibacter termitis]SJZ62290.1 hypothetical protein SAMN02745116_00951 [Pilibacter termitis]
MKILTELIPKDENEEIIFKVHEVTDEILELIARVEQSSKQELVAFLGKQAHLVNIYDIFYIESVDKRTFLYGDL